MSVLKRYTGTAWEVVGGGGGANIPQQPEAPFSPEEDDLWIDTDDSFWPAGSPGSTLAYAEVTTVQGGITTETDLTGLAVTVTVPEGRRIRISAQILPTSTVSTDKLRMRIKEGATSLQFSQEDPIGPTSTTMVASAIETPSAGTHTYKITLARDVGTGTISNNADPTFPSFILVEDITGSSLPYNPASIPVGRLGYAERLTDQTGVTSRVAIGGLSVNVSVPAGRTLRIKLHSGLSRTVADGVTRFFIVQDGSTVQFKDMFVRGALEGHINVDFDVIVSPSAGSHVYTADIQQVTGTGTSGVGAASGEPAFLLVEDITPTPSPGTGAPGSTLAYAERISSQAGITTETDLVGLSATVTVPAGRRVRVTGKGVALKDGTSGYGIGWIYRNGVRIGKWGEDLLPINGESVWQGSYVDTPTAGTHTYKLTMRSLTGSITLNADNSTDQGPAFILIEDITGAVWPEGVPVTTGIITSEPWTPYTPSNTGITIGNGTETAAYVRIGRVVHVRWTFTLGGTSVIGADPRVGLPIAANVGSGLRHVGTLNLLDAGVRNYVGVSLIHESDSTHAFLTHTEAGNAGTVNATNPFTWGATDVIVMSMTYEAAS